MYVSQAFLNKATLSLAISDSSNFSFTKIVIVFLITKFVNWNVINLSYFFAKKEVSLLEYFIKGSATNLWKASKILIGGINTVTISPTQGFCVK